MTADTAEARHYRNLYGGGWGTGEADLAAFELHRMTPGKRYHLAMEALAKDPPKKGATLVELGCASGEALLILADRHPFGRVVGVDVALLPGDGGRIERVAANLNEPWPFEDGEVDCLLAMMLFEHLFSPFDAFHETRRCLAPGGAAYVNVPLVTNLPNRLRLLMGRLPQTSIAYDGWFERRAWDGQHLHYFSMGALRDLARDAGLTLDMVRGVGRMAGLKSRLPGLLAGEVTFRLRRE